MSTKSRSTSKLSAREYAESVGYQVSPVMGANELRVCGRSSKPAFDLNSRVIEDICEGLRLRVPLKEIYRQLNLPLSYHYTWLARGKRQSRGVFREFREAVALAKQVGLTQARTELEDSLLSAATSRSVALNVKTTRLISLTRDQSTIIDEHFLSSPELAEKFKEGIIVKQEVQEIEILPNSRLAKELLAKLAPDEWGKGS